MGDPAGIPASSCACAAGDVANARNASFSWGSPIVIRTPSTAVRADQHAGLGARLAVRGGAVGQRQPDEVGLRLRDVVTGGPERVADPVPLGDDVVRAAEQFVPRSQARDRRRLCATALTLKVMWTLASAAMMAGSATAYPTRSAASRTPWRRCAAPRRCGGAGQVDAVDAGPVVLEVRLVERYDDAGRDGVEEALELLAAQRRAGGVVGVAHEDQTVRSVIAASIASRSWPCSGVSGTGTETAAGDLGHDGVRLERAPRVDDLVALVARRLDQFLAQRHRAAAGRDVLGRPTRATRTARGSARPTCCRVAVRDRRRVRDRLRDAGQRALRGLVAGQLDGPGIAAARHVGRMDSRSARVTGVTMRLCAPRSRALPPWSCQG